MMYYFIFDVVIKENTGCLGLSELSGKIYFCVGKALLDDPLCLSDCRKEPKNYSWKVIMTVCRRYAEPRWDLKYSDILFPYIKNIAGSQLLLPMDCSQCSWFRTDVLWPLSDMSFKKQQHFIATFGVAPQTCYEIHRFLRGFRKELLSCSKLQLGSSELNQGCPFLMHSPI